MGFIKAFQLFFTFIHLSSIRSVASAAAMSEKYQHLSIGSIDPPLQQGKLRLYSMRFCPYSHRAHLTLLAKNISFDPVFINLKAKPEWYTSTVPSGKVPALLIDGQSVYESLIIADFLDEKFPERPLHSRDPLQKAKDRILIESFGKVTSPCYKVMTSPNATLEDFEAIVKELTAFDKELTSRGKTYFGGAQPGMVDYMIWPWFERMEMFKFLHGDKFVLPEDKLPKLTNWVASMKMDEAVKKYLVKPEVHAAFMRTHHSGTPDFDILWH
ncbi:pyrimidodiazepine synthase-like [Macrosteles quadrilineatus]|uniref:pyrimidodiazepine synthase-like n=1 Tax=Macrosteles quadrilineatus TaxID=74068 RepID=UPI0023E14B35|nr:pyrimidodiazepine synthase-like [Macrosteles quadrilineatus]